MNRSSKRSKENMFARLSSSPERSAAIQEVVGKLLGEIPMKEPLPDHIPALERIKIYASESFTSCYGGTEEDFEQLWQEAFPQTEKCGKR